MRNDSHRGSISDSWTHFWRTVLHPWSAIGTVVAIAVAVSVFLFDDQLVRTLLLAILAFITAVLGGIWTNRWIRLIEQREIDIRGQSAIRGLGLLHNDADRVENRLISHEEKFCASGRQAQALREALKGTIDLCRAMKSGVVNAIEHWADVVPEADVRTQLGVVTDILDQKEKAESRVTDLETEIEELGKESAGEKKRLENELEQNKQRIRNLRRELREKGRNFPLSFSSETNIERIPLSDFLAKSRCKKCSKQYEPEPLDLGVCESCRKGGIQDFRVL